MNFCCGQRTTDRGVLRGPRGPKKILYQEMEGREGGSGLVNRDQLLVHLTKQQEARLVKQNHQKEEFDRDLISSQLYTFNKLQKNLAEPCKT